MNGKNKEGRISGRVIFLLIIAIGLWIFVLFYYFGGSIFKAKKTSLIERTEHVAPVELTKEMVLLNKPIVKLERANMDLKGKYFEPIIIEKKDIKEILDIMISGKSAPANFKYIGTIRSGGETKVLISSGGVVKEYELNDVVKDVGVIYYANYLGVLLIDPNTGEYVVMK